MYLIGEKMNCKNVLILTMLLIASVSFPQKRAFTIEDLYKVKNVSSPMLSNSGEKIAFTVSESDLPKGKSITTVYVMNKNGSSLISVSDKVPELIPLSGLQATIFI